MNGILVFGASITYGRGDNKDGGLFSHFDPHLISCEIGLKKPDKRVYKMMLEELNLKANECLLVDDREKYLPIPKSMGFNVIHFQNNGEFVKDLTSLGVII